MLVRVVGRLERDRVEIACGAELREDAESFGPLARLVLEALDERGKALPVDGQLCALQQMQQLPRLRGSRRDRAEITGARAEIRAEAAAAAPRGGGPRPPG